MHDFNPLEQRWICLGVGHIDALTDGSLMDSDERERFFEAFGLGVGEWEEISAAMG